MRGEGKNKPIPIMYCTVFDPYPIILRAGLPDPGPPLQMTRKCCLNSLGVDRHHVSPSPDYTTIQNHWFSSCSTSKQQFCTAMERPHQQETVRAAEQNLIVPRPQPLCPVSWRSRRLPCMFPGCAGCSPHTRGSR